MDLFRVSSVAQRVKVKHLQKEERERAPHHSPEKSVKEKAVISDPRRRVILKNKTQQKGSSEHVNSSEKSRASKKRKWCNIGISSGSNKRARSRNKKQFVLDDSLGHGGDGTNSSNAYDTEESDIVILGETYHGAVKLGNSYNSKEDDIVILGDLYRDTVKYANSYDSDEDDIVFFGETNPSTVKSEMYRDTVKRANSYDSNEDDIVFFGETDLSTVKSANGFEWKEIESKESGDQGKDVEVISEQKYEETDKFDSILSEFATTMEEEDKEERDEKGNDNVCTDDSKLKNSTSTREEQELLDFVDEIFFGWPDESLASAAAKFEESDVSNECLRSSDSEADDSDDEDFDIEHLNSPVSKKSFSSFEDETDIEEITADADKQSVEEGTRHINGLGSKSSRGEKKMSVPILQKPDRRDTADEMPEIGEETKDQKKNLYCDDVEEGECSRISVVKGESSGKESRIGASNLQGSGGRESSNTKQGHLSKVLIDSMLGRFEVLKEKSCEPKTKESCEPQVKQPFSTERTLPLKFRFKDEESKPAVKSEYENMVEGLFSEMYTWMHSDMSNDSPKDTNEKHTCRVKENKIHPCLEGKHDLVLLEDVGEVCRGCNHIEREMRHILPPFAKMRGSAGRKCVDKGQFFGALDFTSSVDNFGKSFIGKDGTVWDMIPGVKETMYQHQQDGFEFLWKNLEGTIDLAELKSPNSNDVGGCIISHAPGTGKTRLTIVFIEAYLKLFPDARPLIIAPASMLLTWEEEFTKWKVGSPFHNLNNIELSGKENKKLLGNISVGKSQDRFIRVVKMYLWNQESSILGISYQLFEKLVGERYRRRKGNKKGQVRIVDQESENIRKILLEQPRLVVLDEGHRPRSQRSCIWNTLLKLQTERRIILSGTLFQNNFMELFNTFHLVRPTIASSLAKEKAFAEMIPSGGRKYQGKRLCDSGTSFNSSSAEEAKLIEMLKERIAPFVHIHKGNILQKSLLGLSNCVVLLNPPPLQKSLIEKIESNQRTFQYDHEVALLSVHPSLLQNCLSSQKENSNVDLEMLTRLRRDPNAGVKTRFIMELVHRSKALNEKVLIFSQYIQPIRLIKGQLIEHFIWEEGKQIFEMHGKLDQKQRQCVIGIFNDPTSEAQVLLASTKCCSEGINLVGASRIILLDVVWNPSVKRQAISRAYRLGQKKVVFTYHLITSGTTEGDKYCRQAEKDRFSELVFSSAAKEDDKQKKPSPVFNDRSLKEMLDNANLMGMFEKIISQPKEVNLVETFGQLLCS